MITQNKNLNLVPGGIPQIINVSQYDKGQTLTFNLYNQGTPFTIPTGAEVSIQGTKPDNHGFAYSCTFSGSIVTAILQQQMTAVAGDVVTEISITKNGNLLATANFILRVEKAALNDDTVISDTEIPVIIELATQQVEDAEAWANGTRNGVPVGPSDPAYHKSSKYWSEQPKAASQITYDNTQSGLPSTDAQGAIDDLKQTLSEMTDTVSDSEPYVLRQGKGNMVDMELVGGSLAWNQKIVNGNFASTSGWTSASSTFSVSNNKGILKATARYGRVSMELTSFADHKYLLFATLKSYKNTGTTWRIRKYKSSDYSVTEDVNVVLSTTENTYAKVETGMYKIGVFVQDDNTSDWGNIELSNFMCIDLTALFGSTIADYIYSLEQATAGAGVAWFRQYFRNLYYAYNPGAIKSVNPSYRKVVGKNLLPLRNAVPRTLNGVTFNVNNDGSVTANGTATATTDFYVYSEGSPNYLATDLGSIKDGCILTGCPSGGSDSKYQLIAASNTGRYATDSGSGATMVIPLSENTIRVLIRVYSGYTCNNLIFKPMIRLATVEDATYEPYKEYSYPFDTSVQLRGIPKLVDNKLSYDGDIYTADGTVTRKYGIVDLGTLDWIYDTSTSTPIFSSPISAIGARTNTADVVCAIYTAKDRFWSQSGNDKCIGIGGGVVNVSNSSYTDAPSFKTAMSGVYLVYPLATPTTESANAYQNPQRAFIDGTEEFVDYGVQSATRDVSIPVGNNTTYQLNETLPPIEDYVDGALKFKAAISALGTDESGRTTASRAYTTGEFFYQDGKMYKVLTSIASGATFTVGTNCQQTTLFAELKALA